MLVRMRHKSFVWAVRCVEKALCDVGLAEDPLGNGDFCVDGDFHDQAILRIWFYLESYGERAHREIVRVLDSLSSDWSAEISFLQIDGMPELPVIVVRKGESFDAQGFADFVSRYGHLAGRLDSSRLR